MIKAMYTASTGMSAQARAVDVISNNLANVNTNGFKKSQVDFQDLLYVDVQRPGVATAQGLEAPNGFQIGSGTRAVSTTKVFSQGVLEPTGRELDVAIEGAGFLKIQTPNGQTAYTRSGTLQLDADLNLVTSEGYTLDPQIALPNDVIAVSIGKDGTVSAITSGSPETATIAGQITLSRFVNPAGLASLGGNLLAETPSSGTPSDVTPGEEGTGTLAQGFLERGNVDVVSELVKLIVAQRAYEINSRSIRASDQMMSTANGIVQ